MRVSVIVPVYNVERYLARCLDSLLAQTYAPAEIICVNDASTDASADILERYRMTHPEQLVVLSHQRNAGLGAARDTGLARARSEGVMFVDSDDFAEPDYVETYVRAMECEPCDVVVGGYLLDGPGRRSAKRRMFPASAWSLGFFSAAWGKLYRRAFLVEHRLVFSNFRYAEDTYFNLCALVAKARCAFIDFAGYHYWQGADSLTRGKVTDENCVSREHVLGELYETVVARAKATGASSETCAMLEYFYLADMLNTLLVFERGCGWKTMRTKYDFFLRHADALFPHWRENPHLRLCDNAPLYRRAKWAVWAFARCEACGAPRLPFRVAARLPQR